MPPTTDIFNKSLRLKMGNPPRGYSHAIFRELTNVANTDQLPNNRAVAQFDSFFESQKECLVAEHPTVIPNDFRA
jgi:hypothetical protein